MKVRREDDGQIVIYNELPSKFRGVTGNYIGGFNLSDTSILEQEGFFDILEPIYNHVLEVLSPIYFDEEKKVFTYAVEVKPGLPTPENAKLSKIADLKKAAREKLNETDWYYIRELRMESLGREKNVPENIIKQNQDIYTLVDLKEAEINALEDLEKILTFDASLNSLNTVIPEMIPVEEIKTEEVLPVELTPTQLLENAKNIERALRLSDYVDYSAVTAALALAESTDEEKTIKANAINDAIRNLVSINVTVNLSAYTVALLAVKAEDYTVGSWSEYQLSVNENIVTESNTQQEVDIATYNIKNAQKRLVVLEKNSTTPTSEGTPATSSSNTAPTSEPVVAATPTPQTAENPTPTEPVSNPVPQAPETLPTPEPVATQEPAPASEPPITPSEEPATQPEVVAEPASSIPPTSA